MYRTARLLSAKKVEYKLKSEAVLRMGGGHVEVQTEIIIVTICKKNEIRIWDASVQLCRATAAYIPSL